MTFRDEFDGLTPKGGDLLEPRGYATLCQARVIARLWDELAVLGPADLLNDDAHERLTEKAGWTLERFQDAAQAAAGTERREASVRGPVGDRSEGENLPAREEADVCPPPATANHRPQRSIVDSLADLIMADITRSAEGPR